MDQSFLKLDFIQKLWNLEVEKSTSFSFSTILKEIVIRFEWCKS